MSLRQLFGAASSVSSSNLQQVEFYAIVWVREKECHAHRESELVREVRLQHVGIAPVNHHRRDDDIFSFGTGGHEHQRAGEAHIIVRDEDRCCAGHWQTQAGKDRGRMSDVRT